MGHVGNDVAALQKLGIASPLSAVPAVRLAVAGDGGFQNDIGMPQLQGQNRVGKVHVTADGHAADEAAKSGLIDSVERGGNLFLQRNTARIGLAHAPGKSHGPVPGKTAGLFFLDHTRLRLAVCSFRAQV